MYVIITHTDPDGFASEYVVRKHLNSFGSLFDPIVKFNYNYSGDTDYIEEYLDRNINVIKDIFITDITLPDRFMDKYAKYITWIDHHKSTVEADKEWKSKLKKNFSKITISDWPDTNGNSPKQISACELAWKYFFPDENPPLGLWLIGRYDVWDHDEFNTTILLNNYINIKLAKYGLDVALSEDFESIIESHHDWWLIEAENLLHHKELIDAAQSIKYVKKVKIFDRIVAAYNGRCTSQFYKEFLKDNDDVEILINYSYNPYTETWFIGCYTTEGRDANALGFLNNYKDIIPNIVSMGGHKNACGMTLKQEDICKFLSTFEKAE